MITRSKIFEQIKAVDCGNTAFEKGNAQSILVVASAGSKELQTSDISTSNFTDNLIYFKSDIDINIL